MGFYLKRHVLLSRDMSYYNVNVCLLLPHNIQLDSESCVKRTSSRNNKTIVLFFFKLSSRVPVCYDQVDMVQRLKTIRAPNSGVTQCLTEKWLWVCRCWRNTMS